MKTPKLVPLLLSLATVAAPLVSASGSNLAPVAVDDQFYVNRSDYFLRNVVARTEPVATTLNCPSGADTPAILVNGLYSGPASTAVACGIMSGLDADKVKTVVSSQFFGEIFHAVVNGVETPVSLADVENSGPASGVVTMDATDFVALLRGGTYRSHDMAWYGDASNGRILLVEGDVSITGNGSPVFFACPAIIHGNLTIDAGSGQGSTAQISRFLYVTGDAQVENLAVASGGALAVAGYLSVTGTVSSSSMGATATFTIGGKLLADGETPLEYTCPLAELLQRHSRQGQDYDPDNPAADLTVDVRSMIQTASSAAAYRMTLYYDNGTEAVAVGTVGATLAGGTAVSLNAGCHFNATGQVVLDSNADVIGDGDLSFGVRPVGTAFSVSPQFSYRIWDNDAAENMQSDAATVTIVVADTIFGGGGDDVIAAIGDGSGDVICADVAGEGEFIVPEYEEEKVYVVTFAAKPGSDTIDGGGGDDVLFGDSGITGLAQKVVAATGVSVDAVTDSDILRYLSEHPDVVANWPGADNSQTDPDTGESLDRADMLIGNDGGDIVFAQGGDDILFGDASLDAVAGWLELSGGDLTSVNMAVKIGAMGVAQLKSDLANLEGSYDGEDLLLGGDGDDMIFGLGGNDELHGGSGSDMLLGGGGADVLHGGADSDYLDGGAGADRIDGGAGPDIIRYDPADTIDGGDDIDILLGNSGDGSFASLTNAGNVEIFLKVENGDIDALNFTDISKLEAVAGLYVDDNGEVWLDDDESWPNNEKWQLVGRENGITTITCAKNDFALTLETTMGYEGGKLAILPVPYINPVTHTTNTCETYHLYTCQTELSDGWYVVVGAVTNDARIVVSGDVNLILTDGAELVAEAGIGLNCDSGVSHVLSIWSQSTKPAVVGRLTATAATRGDAAIGGDAGQICIYGGWISATGLDGGAGIGGGVEIHIADGPEIWEPPNGRLADDNLSVVDAAGHTAPHVVIGPPMLHLREIPSPVYTGSALDPDIVVTYRDNVLPKANYDVSYATNAPGGAVAVPAAVNAGEYTVAVSGKNDYAGFTATATFTVARRPVTVSVADGSVRYNGSERIGSAECDFANVVDGHAAFITYTPAKGTLEGTYTGSFGDDFTVSDGNGADVTSNYILTEMTPGTLTIMPPGVSYLDPVAHTINHCETYAIYAGQTALDSGWYVVAGAVTNDARIVVSGDVNLILADGTELVAKKGINVAVANNTTNSLTIWAQSDGEGMGSLTATQVDVSQYQSAIGGDAGQQGGTVVINGGRVSATGWGAGIGGGDGGSGATDDGVGVSGFHDFQLNGNSTRITDGEVQLSPAQSTKGGTAFWRKRVDVMRPWRAFFTYKTVNVPSSPADGFAFFLHNDARGLSAQGGMGGFLCASGITPSVGTAYNIYHNDSAGWIKDGATTNMTTALGGIAIQDGMDVCVTYDGEGRIVQHLFSNGSYVAFTNDVNLAEALGDTTAWIGFSGATGGSVCDQRITNFRFWQADAKGSAPDISASDDASKWRLNGSAVYESFSNAPAFRITDMSNNTSGLVTRLERVYVGGPFKVHGTYHVTGNSGNDSTMADGIAMFFHSQSPAAIGGKGGDRGVLGNSALPSATGWMINIYPSRPNITPLKNCVQGSSFTALNGIDPKTKVPVDFTLSYVPGRLSFTLEQGGKTATTSQNVDLAQTFGDKFAYFSISGGTGTHNARQYVYNLSMESVNEGGGTVVVNGGTVTAAGNIYGIEAGDGSVTINGGTVTATGADGIYARCGITLGWTKPADSITASSFSSGAGVSVKVGQTLADERQNLYEGTLDADALVAVRNKTLRPYIPPLSFTDPEGRDIEDPGVINWLSENGFTQADIDDLGHDAAATDRLYECWLLNLNFKVQDAGATLCFTDITVSNRVSMTVQLVRKAPLAGRINGMLYLYGANNLAAGFSRSPIPDESVEYFTGDPTFNLVTASNDTVTQTAVATLNSSVTAKFFKATIEVPIPYDPEEP